MSHILNGKVLTALIGTLTDGQLPWNAPDPWAPDTSSASQTPWSSERLTDYLRLTEWKTLKQTQPIVCLSCWTSW